MVAVRRPPVDRGQMLRDHPTLANEVTEHLLHMKLSSRALEFCLSLFEHTFGKEDLHRTAGRTLWRCPFDLSTWARALDWDKSNLRRLRLQLEVCHIVLFEPDQDLPGQGWLEWNLAFEEWQLYDGRRTRQPAQRGRQQQPGVVNLTYQEPGEQVGIVNVPPAQIAATGAKELCALALAPQQMTTPASSQVAPAQEPGTHIQQANVVILSPAEVAGGAATQPRLLEVEGPQMTTPASSHVAPEQGSVAPSQQASVVNSLHPAAEPTDTKELCPLAGNSAQMTTPASFQVVPEEASEILLRKKERNDITETPAGVSEMQSISPKAYKTVALPQNEDEARGAFLPLVEPTSNREAHDHHPSLRAFAWPARAPHEQTDLDFYQRVVREHEGQRVALLTRLAHERLSIPLASKSYSRIGALAKQCGAGLLVKHILLATAQHIDGDPLDYLTKLATNAKQKEQSDGTRPSSPIQRATAYPSNIQTYTPEEAKQLVWHTL